MGAKIILTGKPHHVRRAATSAPGVEFEVSAGPPNASTPKGMPIFGPATYQVVCPQRMWNKGHLDENDRSDVIVEGYLEPRVGAGGQSYIAVVAMSLTTKLADITGQARELLAEATEAASTYQALCSQYGEDASVTQAARTKMEKLQTGLARYCEANREMLRPETLLQKAGGSSPFQQKKNGGVKSVELPTPTLAE